jgi:hypothetical protein
MNKEFQPDLFSGKALRDSGIAQVLDRNEGWLESCVKEAQRFVSTHGNGEFTGEDIRYHCRMLVGHPHHHNAWGGLINILVKRKIIRPTGRWKPMRDPGSHARRTPIYVRFPL